MSSIAVLKNGIAGKNAPYESINQQDRILSLSGGGVKGIAELVVLAEIEERTGKSISELWLCRIYTSCLVFSLKPKILDIMLPLTF